MNKILSQVSKQQQRLVNALIEQGVIVQKEVETVMNSIDRADFTGKMYAYAEFPQPIGYNATISAPVMHAHALEILKKKLLTGSRCLDVGSGSGYLTLAFAKMMEMGKNANNFISVGVEHIGKLAKASIENINKNHNQYIESKKVQIFEADGREGYKELAPYDCIHVGAAAEVVPKELIDQLAIEGQLIVPVGKIGYQDFMLITKDKSGKISSKSLFGVTYVPLTSKRQQLGHEEEL